MSFARCFLMMSGSQTATCEMSLVEEDGLTTTFRSLINNMFGHALHYFCQMTKDWTKAPFGDLLSDALRIVSTHFDGLVDNGSH